jgi:tRNA1Val (adenine37-N6)-methyltransferase
VREAKVTKDALFRGRLTVWQPAHGTGYRTNVDAILLASFAAASKARTAVDLGAGVGAVGLTLLSFDAAERVTFVEKDATVADLCRRNLKANRLEERGDVRVVDLEEPLEATAPDVLHAAQLVVANPPYVTPGRDGRRSVDRAAAGRIAGRRGSLAPFVRAAAAALGRRGRACFVYPAHALLELTALARQAGLEPKRARFVHGKADRPARVVLVELARAKPGGLVVLPALVEVGDDGKPTRELASLLRAGDADRAGDRG